MTSYVNPVATLDPTKYPALDKIPPIDSPEVQEWIKQVQATGIEIPSFNATVAGWSVIKIPQQ